MRTRSLRLLRLALGTLHMLAAASAAFKSRATLHLENLALRHQLTVLRRSVKAPTDVRRPASLGMAVRSLDRLAVFLSHCQTGNRPLAATARASSCSGPGKLVAANPGAQRCRCRPSPYLNHVLEQDHRFIKKRIAASLWFRSVGGAEHDRWI